MKLKKLLNHQRIFENFDKKQLQFLYNLLLYVLLLQLQQIYIGKIILLSQFQFSKSLWMKLLKVIKRSVVMVMDMLARFQIKIIQESNLLYKVYYNSLNNFSTTEKLSKFTTHTSSWFLQLRMKHLKLLKNLQICF